MTVHCSVPYSVVHVLLLVHEPLLNVRYAWGNGEAARAAIPHCLSLDTCQGNTTSVNRHKAYRRTGASMRYGTRLRKGKVKTMGMKKCNMPWVREGVSIPLWCNGMCVIGSWERPELRDRVRCCFDGLRACGNKSGKLGIVRMSPALWQQNVWQEGEVKAMVCRNRCLCRKQDVVIASHVCHHLPLPPLPVLAVEQRSVNSRSIAELFSLCNFQTFLDVMLVFWGVIFKSPACFLRSIVFSTIFFCRLKMRSSFIGLSPDWDFLFFSSCLQNQEEAMRRQNNVNPQNKSFWAYITLNIMNLLLLLGTS